MEGAPPATGSHPPGSRPDPASAAGPGPASPGHHAPAPSPDGTRIAWISDVTGRPRVHVAPLPADGPVDAGDGSAPTALPVDGIEHPDATALSWSPDGSLIAAQIAPSGVDRSRVVLLDPDGGPFRDVAPGATAVVLGAWEPAGRRLGVTVLGAGGDPASDDYGAGTASLVDVRDGSSVVVGTGQAAAVQAVSADGRLVLRSGRRGRRALELLDLRSGARERLVDEALVATARFGTSPGTLWLHTDAGREHPALLAVPLGTGADRRAAPPRPVAARDGADLELVTTDPNGARAALVWNVGGASELTVAELRGGRSYGLLVDATVVTGVAFVPDGSALLVAGHAPGVPPHVVRVPLDGGPVTPLLGTPAPPPSRSRPERLTFPAGDGLRLHGWLHRPQAPNGAGMIWLHGGPESEERPGWAPLLQELTAAGVTVLTPNVRGSSGRGRSFAGLDDGELRPYSLTDVHAAARLLGQVPGLDRSRIVVGGRSYGGYLALSALTRFPELFAGGVDVCGMADLPAFYAETEPWIAGAAHPEYGDPRTDRELLERLSPLRETDRIAAPVLVVHGERDTNVPVGQAHALHDALAARGAPVDLMLLPDEGHEVHDRHTRARATARIVDWVLALVRRC